MDKEVSKHKDVLLNLVLFTLREYFYLFIFFFKKKEDFIWKFMDIQVGFIILLYIK